MKTGRPQGPRLDRRLSGGEKTRLARRFRRWAAVTDVCAVLFPLLVLTVFLLFRTSVRTPLALDAVLAAGILLSLAGELVGTAMAFRRCPFCEKPLGGLDWRAGPFRRRAVPTAVLSPIGSGGRTAERFGQAAGCA